jgi:predicted deacylase
VDIVATIRIRDIEAAPGEATFGRIPVGEWGDGSPIEVPVAIVNGRQPGPVFLAMACLHGDEMVGTHTVSRVVSGLEPGTMSGAFIGVLAANAPAFILGTRVNQLEHPTGSNDLKRIFDTASPSGSLSERIASLVRDEIVPHCEYYADLHSSAIGSVNYPRAIVAGEYIDAPKEIHEKLGVLADACNFEYVFKPSGAAWEGMYFRPSFPLEEKHQKAGIVLETGYAPTADGVEDLTDSLQRILARLGLREGPHERTMPLTFLERLLAIRATRGGLWHPEVGIGEEVDAGQMLGTISDVFGETVEETFAPAAGVVIKVATSATVSTGVRTHVLGVRYE